MQRPARILAVSGCVMFLLSTATGRTEEVQPATDTALVPLPETTSEKSVQFSQQPAEVGDRVAQQIDFAMHLNTSILQSDQIAHQQSVSQEHRQQRLVEVLEVAQGNVRQARVTFPQSRGTSPDGENPDKEVVEPVEGKAYLVTRQGKQLLVTDVNGAIPPRAEFEIVYTSMQSLGLPNPLAAFLLGRTIHVGETIEVPQSIASEMLGFGAELGEVKQFQLRLKEPATYEGSPCAVFDAKILVAGGADQPLRVGVVGPVVILTESCRTVVTELTGPLSVDAVEHTRGGSYQYQGSGEVRVAVHAHYRSRSQ